MKRPEFIKYLIASAGLSLACTAAAHAAPPPKPPLIHKALRSADLPEPGMPIHLSIVPSDTKAMVSTGYLQAVRDGSFMQLPLVPTADQNGDELIYEAVVSAPVHELSYHFVASLNTGKVVNTPQVTARRSCRPDIGLSSGSTPANASTEERLESLLLTAKDLEGELKDYQRANTLLEQLLAQIDKLSGQSKE